MLSRRNRRGNYALTFALVLPVLLGFTAMGVDWGAVAVARIQVQAAADAAAMAATTSMDDTDTATTRAEAYAQHVKMNNITPVLTSLEMGEWDADRREFRTNASKPNAVRARTEAEVPLYFTQLFGWDAVTVRGEAGAGLSLPVRAPDLVMVLDVTSSMNVHEVRAEREAAEAMLECLYENSAPESRVSLVTFTGVDQVQVGMSEIGSDYRELMRTAGNIQGCGRRGAPACSNTNPSSGYEAALSVLETANTPEGVGQVIMLMSDGEPTPYGGICSRGFLRKYDRGDILFPLRERCAEANWGWGINQRKLLDWSERARDKAEDRDIDTYSVFYGRNRRGSLFLEASIRAGEGTHHEAVNASDMADAFTDVCLEYTKSDATLIF